MILLQKNHKEHKMRIVANTQGYKSYTKNFKRSQENHIEKQVKQLMFENFDTIKMETVNQSKDEIEKIYLPQFKKELIDEKGYVSFDDLKTIFSKLASVYKKAGIEKDSVILNDFATR